ncbi:MOSC N-terminal beta barrel domain-containing protein [Castellaniella sp. GW247-6E4]|uniref:MOSC N-terminal beta barrel domain-containing protein n=1 Tax=Castellaniella sp. GW247-6E4 TaxID=3140380 RepID=UPI00331610D8
MTTNPLSTPIAACQALDHPGAPAYDRRWLVVDEDREWLDASRAEGLARIELGIRFGYLVLRAPGMLRLDIPMDVIEDDDSVVGEARVGSQAVRVVDEGDLAAAWLAELLGRPARLVKVHPEAEPVVWP